MKHEHGGYGFFIGGDPRRFMPDQENDPEELAAHKAACDAWAAAEKKGEAPEPLPGSCVHAGNVILTLRGFGLGGYSYDCDDPECDEAKAPPDDEDPDDPHAAFVTWWKARSAAEVDQDLEGGPEGTARAAFIAGFRAREDLPWPRQA